MNLEFSDVNLPYVNFSDLKNLPTCSGIYFVLDSNHIFYYIGKAENIQKRWKNHHRKDQIENIHVKYPVKIFWLVWNQDDLDNAEKYFINCYKPLLNNTKVELPKIIPSEIFLKKLLRKIARKTFAIGMTRGNSTTLIKIYLKYDAKDYTSRGAAAIIKKFQADNKTCSLKIKRSRYAKEMIGIFYPISSRDHRQQAKENRAFNNHWEIACNGIIIDITPEDGIDELLFLKQSSTDWRLANVKMQALSTSAFATMIKKHQGITTLLPPLFPLDLNVDPIPLFWKDWRE